MKKPRVKMGPMDFILFCTLMLLICIGIVMVFSASSYVAGHSTPNNDYAFYLKKQFLWAIIGFVAMIFTLRIDYHKIKKLTLPLIVITVILLIVVFFCPDTNGAKRWIPLGFASIQPSEIAKYTVVLYMARSMEYKGENIKKFVYGILPYLIVSGLFAGLVLKEKNLSIAAVIMIVTLIMLFAAGARMTQIGALLPPLFGIGYYYIVTESYRLRRLMNFIDPFKDMQKDGYQLVQSLLALGSGGILGVGIGQSRQKCFYLPEPHNDFIFAVIGEELGLVGCIVIIILFLILIWRGIITAIKAKDTYGTLLAIGITSVIAVQAVINIAVVTGSMPVTGVTLPFISYGGSSLFVNMVAMGVLLNISRQSN